MGHSGGAAAMRGRCWPTALRAKAYFNQNEDGAFEYVPIGTDWLFFACARGYLATAAPSTDSEDWEKG